MTSVPRGTLGPHWAQRGDDRIALWGVPQGDGAGWFTLSLPRDGSPGAPVRVGDVGEGVQIVRLIPDGASGFLALVVRRHRDVHVVEALRLGPEGLLRSGPQALGESPAPIVWIDAVPTARGAVVTWAERADGLVDLYAVPAGPLGAEQGPRRIMRRASAWQVKPFGRAAALAGIEEGEGGRRVMVRYVADDGTEARPAVTVRVAPELGAEIDLLVTRGRSFVAWTETQAAGRRLLLAELDRDGSLSHEAWPLTPPRGRQTLFELIGRPEGGQAYIAWEEPSQRPLTGSNVLLAPLGEAGTPLEGPALELQVGGYDGTLPLFGAHPEGVVAVTRGSVCSSDVEECESPGSAIVAVALDQALRPRGASPVRVGSSQLDSALLWDLACDDECFALAAVTDTSSHVYLTRLEPDSTRHVPAEFLDDRTRPRLLSEQTLTTVPELAALEGWQGTDGTVLTWLSYFDPTTPWVVPAKPAPDGRRAPVRAVLRAQTLGTANADQTVPVAAEETLSWRAHSLGGLALAPGAGTEKLVVWSALDEQVPQVFATVVDGRGKRLRQRMVTRTPGEVLDVAAARLDAGWLLAWVDGRSDGLEVHTTRLDDKLENQGVEVSLTHGGVSPTGVQLLRRGDQVFVAWSSAGRGDAEPQGDVFLAVLSAVDGSVLSSPRRVAATREHSHSPRLVPSGEGALLAWLEGDPELRGEPQGTLRLLPLDAVGRSGSAPQTVPLPGRPSGFSMSCDADGCRAAIAVDVGARSEMWGLVVPAPTAAASETVALRRLTALSSRHANTVAPLLLDGKVYYLDALGDREPELRRIEVRWR